MRVLAVVMATTCLGFVFRVHAQERNDSSGPAVYKVEFDIGDRNDGATQPSEHFSMLIAESRKGTFQSVNRVPVASGSSQYVDVGANIQCTVHESDGKAALHGEIELTRIMGQVNLSGISQPIIGQRKIAFDVMLELSSPAVIIDDRNALAAKPHSLNRMDAPAPAIPARSPAVPARYQVQATVTKVN
jgi:hypothetical protein